MPAFASHRCGKYIAMKRIPEQELMSEREQAEAYARADFEESHGRIVPLFEAEFPGTEIRGRILDLGCGPGDVTFRFARRFPRASIIAIDGSEAMIELAQQRRAREPDVGEWITFIKGVIPGASIPRGDYAVVMSTSFLHHLRDPAILWKAVDEHAHPGSKIFVYDLFRPPSRGEARRLVNMYSGREPEVLKGDFYNSLLAAFEPDEVEAQLVAACLTELSVRTASDRHLIVSGLKRGHLT
jgi:SAM-dependent methyltransferase